MLARPADQIPVGRDVVYEPKLGGFRVLVRTGAEPEQRSRRGADLESAFPVIIAARSFNSGGYRFCDACVAPIAATFQATPLTNPRAAQCKAPHVAFPCPYDLRGQHSWLS